MNRTRPAVIVELVTANTAHLHTELNGRQVLQWLRRLDIPCQWNQQRQLWMIPGKRVADLIADCEHSDQPVRVYEAQP